MKNYIPAVILFPVIYLLLYLAFLLPNAFTPIALNYNTLNKHPIGIQSEVTMEDCFIVRQ